MKKKFIAVYALIGVLALGSTTLTSCVDDNESASVTAVRDAKAAQLNALAAYQNAQAASEKIIGEAEAAIRNAEAEAKRIANELENIELQKAQATLSTDLEALKAKAEAELMNQQAVLEQAKANLILASNQADAAVQTKISQLLEAANAVMYGGEYFIGNNQNYWYDENTGQGGYTTYYIAPSASIAGVDGLQSQLLDKKAEQITVKYNLEDTKRIMADLLTEERTDSAANEALLAAYNEYKTTNKEEALKLAQEAEAAKVSLKKIEDDAQAAVDADNVKVSEAIGKVKATEVGDIYYNTSNWYVDVDGNNIADVVLIDYLDIEATKAETIKFTYDDGTSGQYTPSYNNKIVLLADDLSAKIASTDRSIKVAEADLEAVKKTRDEALAADNTTYKSYKDAVTAAQKAFDDEATDANRIALESAIAALESYEDSAEAPVETATKELERLNAVKKTLADFQTLMTGDVYKTYETVYAEYVSAVDAQSTAEVAKMKAVYNHQVQVQLAQTLASYATGLTDWNEAISSVTSELNGNKEKIEKLTAGLYSGTEAGANVSEAARQDAIDVIAKQIEALETRIAQMQAQYDGYMAEVEALINGETGLPEVPETPSTDTPAEGEGEETPAE